MTLFNKLSLSDFLKPVHLAIFNELDRKSKEFFRNGTSEEIAQNLIDAHYPMFPAIDVASKENHTPSFSIESYGPFGSQIQLETVTYQIDITGGDTDFFEVIPVKRPQNIVHHVGILEDKIQFSIPFKGGTLKNNPAGIQTVKDDLELALNITNTTLNILEEEYRTKINETKTGLINHINQIKKDLEDNDDLINQLKF